MKTRIKFSIQVLLFTSLIFTVQKGLSQSETVQVESFNKVIVSPHIQVIFQQGDEESVTIQSNTESRDKLNIEVNGKTLRIYLDDAKMTTKQEKVDYEEWKGKQSIYQGTVVTATVTYKDIDELSLRGDEKFWCESLIDNEKFVLTIYGNSKVSLNEVDIKNLKVTIYGESTLKLKSGKVESQKLTVYGESEVNTLDIENKSTKLIAYGEGEYKLNVTERLKVTAYGEAEIHYKGNPTLDKGVVIGEATIRAID